MALQDSIRALTALIFGRFEKAVMDECYISAFKAGLFHLLLANIYEARHGSLYETYLSTGAFQETMSHLEQCKGIIFF